MKAGTNMQDGRDVGPARAPFNRVPDEQLERIQKALDRANAYKI